MKKRIRIFNGKKFELDGIFPTEMSAARRACNLESVGYYVRVIALKNGHSVWFSEKRKTI